jgi:hypothetical protein
MTLPFRADRRHTASGRETIPGAGSNRRASNPNSAIEGHGVRGTLPHSPRPFGQAGASGLFVPPGVSAPEGFTAEIEKMVNSTRFLNGTVARRHVFDRDSELRRVADAKIRRRL